MASDFRRPPPPARAKVLAELTAAFPGGVSTLDLIERTGSPRVQARIHELMREDGWKIAVDESGPVAVYRLESLEPGEPGERIPRWVQEQGADAARGAREAVYDRWRRGELVRGATPAPPVEEVSILDQLDALAAK